MRREETITTVEGDEDRRCPHVSFQTKTVEAVSMIGGLRDLDLKPVPVLNADGNVDTGSATMRPPLKNGRLA